MGLEVLERSIKHFEKAKKVFMKECAELGTQKDQQLMDDIEKLELSINTTKNLLIEERSNLTSCSKQSKEIQLRLRTLEETKDLQEDKERLENEITELEEKLKENSNLITQLVSKNGYLAFSKDLIRKATLLLDEKREKNQIPTGIKQQFIEDLLEKRECICGRPIQEHTREYELLQSWFSRSSSKELEDAYLNTSAGLKYSCSERNLFYNRFYEFGTERETMIRVRKNKIDEINEIQLKLDGKDKEEISSLVKKEQELSKQMDEIKERIHHLEYQMNQDSMQLREKNKEMERVQLQNSEAELARTRARNCEHLKSAFSEILVARSKEVQQLLRTKINEVYSQLLRKNFYINLTEGYDIEVYKVFGKETKSAGMSQGERQITSLSFIGALVNIAREQYEKNKEGETSSVNIGGYYPIVMDSPFGQLDQDHRSRVAKGLPGLAHQIIVIVSSSQWEGEVKNKMMDRIGKEYKLNFVSNEGYTEIEEVKDL